MRLQGHQRANTGTVTGLDVAQPVARRLVVLFGRIGSVELVTAQVGPHKKSICAREIATDKLVAFGLTHLDQRTKAGTKIVGALPVHLRIIDLRNCKRGRPGAVILDNHNSGVDRCYGLPDPDIVTIDINAEQADLAGHAAFGEQLVYIVPRNKGLRGLELAVLDIGGQMLADLRDVFVATLEPQAAPATGQQRQRIALDTAFHTEFDEGARHLVTETTDDFVDDTILIVLRINLVAKAREALLFLIAGLAQGFFPVLARFHLQDLTIDGGLCHKVAGEGIGLPWRGSSEGDRLVHAPSIGTKTNRCYS